MTNLKLPEINVGVVGHIDHGKTTLLSRLTGKFADTHSEELKRGITIKLGYADIIISEDKGKYNSKGKGKPVRYVSFIDAPGHEMLMATMLSGAATMDAAILVVAANEGIKPQTQEHLMALQAKKIKNIIIVQNKIDLVSKEKALANYKTIKTFIKNTIAADAPIIPVSAQQGVNIDKILETLNKIKIPERELNTEPIFIVARSFDINRPGTIIKKLNGGVLGGILKKGKLKVGDQIEIKPGLSQKKSNQLTYQPLTTTIISLHKGSNSVKEVEPGASISIETNLDPYLTKTDSLTGCLVSTKGNLPEIKNTIKIKAELFEKILGTSDHSKVESLKTKEMLMLSVNTTISVGIVETISKNNEVELSLNIPVVALEGDNVGLARNINGHWRLIGYGEIL
ncbi:translation initiation factor IF-2 subunit gamma [archaeon]|jgi:translation initiation factor 2 subunit 3|nr:translation initiation factor IF-2 subunit gamma [archaeon]MBT4373732.1 translation initiation factor IF-2 subunit gamma [archaeon]MBT4532309.1 translation initiation factor IF-2 subunit gamma [archaeon]MBT7001945.1 translation initiation factor IF-2 subunit gamma [archaeon]MBT7282750.1 translation initiation factor IF-2 subunit gamma [archaeon]